MRIETRLRTTGDISKGELRLKHYDLCLISESEEESKIIDLLGQPESTLKGEIRLADGYGEHYILLQPKHQVQEHGDYRDFD